MTRAVTARHTTQPNLFERSSVFRTSACARVGTTCGNRATRRQYPIQPHANRKNASPASRCIRYDQVVFTPRAVRDLGEHDRPGAAAERVTRAEPVHVVRDPQSHG